jgi:hypothetical protein
MRRLLSFVASIVVVLPGVMDCRMSGIVSFASAADAPAIVTQIDELIARRWKDADATPAGVADDAEYLRRVSLHVNGCIPAVSTVRSFLADTSADKRPRHVEEMLDGAAYVASFSRYWRDVMLPDSSDPTTIGYAPGFEAWLREQLIDDVPYDVLAQKILMGRNAAGGIILRDARSRQQATPVGFYLSRQSVPENLAAATSRIFLGTRIECAQCHDHPFGEWNQDQFWSLAAFFADARQTDPFSDGSKSVAKNADHLMLKVPGTERVARPVFLDGSAPKWSDAVEPQKTLAEWITMRDNPWFARTAVNRLWSHFFGRGLVDPVDDFSARNAASHPEVLDLLAREFVEHRYDIKFLIRVITQTRAYQLSSIRTDASQDEPQLFARMPVHWLSSSVIAESWMQATGTRRPFDQNAVYRRREAGGFGELFAEDGLSPTEREATIRQALLLMNGTLVTAATDLRNSRTLAAVAEAPFLKTGDKIEALFLAALSRRPTEKERERLVMYVLSGGPAKEEAEALADVFWALLNSSEFLLNH